MVLRGRHRQLWASGFYFGRRRRRLWAAVVLRAADHSEVELEQLADSAPSSSPAFIAGAAAHEEVDPTAVELLRARLPLIQH